MVLTTATVKFSKGTNPVAALTDLKSVDIQWGLMPLRPFADQLGAYTNLGIYSITFSAKKGSNATLDAVKDFEEVNIQYDSGSETYDFKGKVISRKTMSKVISGTNTELTVLTVLPNDDCTVAAK